MEVSGTQDFPAIRSSDVFRTFARRFARLMYLRRVCEAGHPVLSVELELVEMARSKLQEFILVRVPAPRLKLLRPVLESWVRSVALELTLGLEDEDYIKEEVVEAVRTENLADLLPVIH